MQATKLPTDAKAGPTKPEVRTVLARKLALGPDDRFVEVGSCTGTDTNRYSSVFRRVDGEDVLVIETEAEPAQDEPDPADGGAAFGRCARCRGIDINDR